MPPNSTQNLNAKLSLTAAGRERSARLTSFRRPPVPGSAPQVKIVSGARQYRGGYWLNV